MLKKAELRAKEQRIAQARLQGKKLKEIAKEEYPNASKHAGEVQVSRVLKKPRVAQYIEQEKTVALKTYGFTWDRIIRKLNDKIDATKSDFHTGELVDDNSTQLQALKMVISLLDLPKDTNESQIKDKLLDISSNADEIQLVRLLKKENK